MKKMAVTNSRIEELVREDLSTNGNPPFMNQHVPQIREIRHLEYYPELKNRIDKC